MSILVTNNKDSNMLGKRLAQERQRLGFSQKQMSENMGIGRSALGMIEIGQAPLDAQRLIELGGLGVDVVYVLSGETSRVAAASMLDWGLLENIQRGVRAWSAKHKISLSPEKEMLVLKILYLRFSKTGAVDTDGLEETLRLAA
jgi:hypothetical protein